VTGGWADHTPDGFRPVEATRLRLLEATVDTLSRFGARKLNMSAVAAVAGVSRPTLYRYFPSKQALLSALAEYQQWRFDAGLADAIRRVPREDQLDAVLCFVVQFQTDDRTRRLVDIEPTFVLDRLTRMLPAQRESLARLLADSLEHTSASDGARRGLATRRDRRPDRAHGIVVLLDSGRRRDPVAPDAAGGGADRAGSFRGRADSVGPR